MLEFPPEDDSANNINMLLSLSFFLCEQVHFQFNKFLVSYKWNETIILAGATNIADPVLRNVCYGGIWNIYLGDFLKKIN